MERLPRFRHLIGFRHDSVGESLNDRDQLQSLFAATIPGRRLGDADPRASQAQAYQTALIAHSAATNHTSFRRKPMRPTVAPQIAAMAKPAITRPTRASSTLPRRISRIWAMT
jgi:hypothetical protein